MKRGRQKAECRSQKWNASACWLLAIGYWLSTRVAFPLRAATNDLADTNTIPPLRPPKPEILPGFWGQHGGLVAAAGVTLLLVVLVLWKLLTRPRPSIAPAAVEVARQALHPLLPHREDPVLLARVGSILRQYFVVAFELPRAEFTNLELGRQLAGHPKVDPALRIAITELLEGMEHRQFGAEVNASEPGVVEQALDLVNQVEARLTAAARATDSTGRPT